MITTRCCVGALILLLAVNQLIDRSEAADTLECGRRSAQGSLSRIYNGRRALPGELPFQALVMVDRFHYCGGVIYDEYHILTSAQLVHNVSADRVEVLVGVNNLLEPEITKKIFRVDSIIVHEEFSPSSLNDDIALIRVMHKMTFSLDKSVNRVCMPDKDKCKRGQLIFASGWGHTDADSSHDALRLVDLRVERCEDKFIHSRKNRKGICIGDEGGPIFHIIKNQTVELIGLISQVDDCYNHPPGVDSTGNGQPQHTKILHYIDWIEENAKLDDNDHNKSSHSRG